MKSKTTILSLLLVAFFIDAKICHAQITIRVEKPGSENVDIEELYIAGNFNNWNPKDAAYRTKSESPNKTSIVIDPPAGTLEFKFTRGAWDKVETDAQGNDVSNRVLEYDGSPKTLNLVIQGWKDKLTPTIVASGTASKNVAILDDRFYIPQLDRHRRIWLYLPPDYETSKKSYPVMYMHDGQNLFDKRTSYAGEWHIDESLNALFEEGDKGIIVVGIENGETFRTDEYTPWENEQYGGGQGDAYAQFIVETLKPYIDHHYRTMSNRGNTAIMGSSLGGLISFYTALKYQEIFGMAGVFSPSFWFSDRIYDLVDEVGKVEEMKFYILGGALESATLLDEIHAMAVTMKVAGFGEEEIKVSTHEDGNHNEQYWSREFREAYLWLFNK